MPGNCWSGIDDHQLADLVLRLREDGRLCVISDEDEAREPRLICTMGLAAPDWLERAWGTSPDFPDRPPQPLRSEETP